MMCQLGISFNEAEKFCVDIFEKKKKKPAAPIFIINRTSIK